MERLTIQLKKTLGLLSIGTLLEYFDLMLYVHMAVLLNGLFYEPTDKHSAALLSAFGFTITFLFRPIGALIFGYIGDNFGRKPVLVLTTIIMALSCLIMANLPTYAQIGFTASVMMTVCRIMQSLSSTGEVTSCELYIMESTRPPVQYPAMGIVPLFAAFGGTLALAVASVATIEGFNWRYAFWAGIIIAVVGMYARKNLKETPEYVNIKNKIKLAAEKYNVSPTEARNLLNLKEEDTKTKTWIAILIIDCVYPLYYYFAYIYAGDLFQNLFNYSAEDVIHHNFIMSFADLGMIVFLMWISYYINPLKILKVQLAISAILVLALPFLLNNVTEAYHLTIIQYAVALFAVHGFPGFPIFYKHIHILQRSKYAGLTYACGRAIMFAITSFGLVVLIEKFGNIGLLILFVPILIGYTLSLFYFDNLEKQNISN
jgi:MFS transporter, MHS family, proline/betaine transporter